MTDNANDKVSCICCKFMSPIFNNLSKQELNYLREISHEVVFQAGEIIFKQGTPLTHVICISSGATKLYVELSGKKKIILRLLLPTDIAGVSGINSDHKHHFSLSAIETTNICFIEVSAFKKIIRENPTFAYGIIGYINNSHNRLYSKLKNFTQKNTNGKVADTLLYLANEVYNNDTFVTLLSRQDMADMSITTRESTIRILKEFKDQYIIDFSEKHFEILQKELLRRISQFG